MVAVGMIPEIARRWQADRATAARFGAAESTPTPMRHGGRSRHGTSAERVVALRCVASTGGRTARPWQPPVTRSAAGR
ncbi:MAG: hypothetical protein ACYCV6_15545 [Steroidobacteraceae bacterium]